jgi:hypothetical protein
VREAQTRWSKYHCHAGLRGRPLRRSNEETIERAPSSDTTAVAEASTGDMRSRRITFRGGRRFRCEDLG